MKLIIEYIGLLVFAFVLLVGGHLKDKLLGRRRKQ